MEDAGDPKYKNFYNLQISYKTEFVTLANGERIAYR